MSSKMHQILVKIADMLERVANGLLNAIELVIIDAVYGKAKYRRRTRQPRPIVQRVVIYRESAPRVHVVKRQK